MQMKKLITTKLKLTAKEDLMHAKHNLKSILSEAKDVDNLYNSDDESTENLPIVIGKKVIDETDDLL